MTGSIAVDFATLFQGRTDAYGTGAGPVVRETPTLTQFVDHLNGGGGGLGIFPLRDDGTVTFAAIDLDRPDFDTAFALADWLPAEAWVERSRSGNAHVWVFFAESCEAWVARAILRAALEVLGEEGVEVFPKQDKVRPGGLGNFINLPYHGDGRPMLYGDLDSAIGIKPIYLEDFLFRALRTRTDPDAWKRRAVQFGAHEPGTFEGSEFGTQENLHECAPYIVQRALNHERPLADGSRHVVMFCLAKMLANWANKPSDAWVLNKLADVNATADRPLELYELNRIYNTVLDGRYTSTGCDDPLMVDYVRPNCPIMLGQHG